MRLETKRHSSKSGLFLMELMIAILFFSLASGICVQLFSKAYLISRESGELNMATLQAQTVAETFQSVDGSHERFQAAIGDAGDGQDGLLLQIPYDADWQRCDAAVAAYRTQVTLRRSEQLSFADVVVERADGSDIYAITATCYDWEG